MIKFPHFGIWLPPDGSHIPKWQKKGRAAVGDFPGRPSLLALVLALFVTCLPYYLLCLLLALFYLDLVVS